jgi:hypothetical protein
MNLNIDLPAEIEGTLREQAAAAGQDVPTFVREILTERLAQEVATESPRTASHEEFMDKLRRIIDLHPVSTWMVDDSRESIYGGRGE